MKYLTALLFIFVITSSLFAQDISKMTFAQLDSIVQHYLSLEDYKTVAPFAQKALEIATTKFGTNDTIFARLQYSVGIVYDSQRDHNKALEHYQIAQKIQEKQVPNSIDYAHTISAINIIKLHILREYQGVKEAFEHAANIFKNKLGENSQAYANSIDNLASCYNIQGQYDQAEKLYLKGLNLNKKINGVKSYNYAISLSNLATIYSNIGKYDEAEPFFLQAITIFKNVLGEEDYSVGVLLNNLADMYSSIGKYEESEIMFLQALEIFKKVLGEEHPNYIRTVANLSYLYKNAKKYDLAEKLMLDIKSKYQAIFGVNHIDYARSLNNLGLLYLDLHRENEAKPLFAQAQKIAKNTLGESHPTYAQYLNNQAILYTHLEEYKLAETFYLEAKRIRQQFLGETHPYYANTLLNLAEVYLNTNRVDTAWAYCWASFAINSDNFDEVFPNVFGLENKNSNPKYNPDSCKAKLKLEYLQNLSLLNFRDIETTRWALTVLLRVVNLYKESATNQKEILNLYFNLCKTAVKINEKTRIDFASNSNKLNYNKKNSVFIENGIQTVLNLKELGDFNYKDYSNYIKEAFILSEQNKSVLLAEAIQNNKAATWGELPDSLAKQEATLQLKKDELKKKKYTAQTAEEVNAIIKQENNLTNQIQEFLQKLKMNYPKYYALRYESLVAKTENVQQLLDSKKLFLEYYVMDSIVYLFALNNNGIELFPIMLESGLLQTKVKELRNALSNYKFVIDDPINAYQSYTSSAYWFFQTFIEPALKDRQVDNLIIVADGELGHLPFEAFLTKPAPQKQTAYNQLPYLLKKYNISYNYSATLLVETRKKTSPTSQKNNGKLLAFAASYPEYEEWTKGSSSTDDSLSSSLSEIRLPHLISLRKKLNPLSETQREIDGLSEVFDGLFLKKEASNEANFKKNASDYAVIHLAMHGLLHPKIPMLSSLVFTENRDSLEDNFLQAYEISHLKLNADLVVLSACETGYGKFEEGEGIMSMARSFMYAGVPSLVVSLWQVNDLSTSVIMKEFYNNLAQGFSKDEALKLAKINYMNTSEGTASHPAFWSAFIQLGDSSPISIKTKSTFFWWGVIGVVALVLGSLFYLFKRKIR